MNASDGTYTDKIRVTWNSSSGATSYTVYRATSSSGSKTTVGTTSSTSYNDTSSSLSAKTTYYYWVKASNSAGTSGFSSYDTGWKDSAAVANQAPVFTSASPNDDYIAMLVGETKYFTVTASDPDGDPITMGWYWCEADDEDWNFCGYGEGLNFTPQWAGDYYIGVELSDGTHYVSGYWEVHVFPPGANGNIQGFVTRLYQLCLGRDPDQTGLNNWCQQLVSGANDGANVAFGFFMSQEMANRGLSNGDFVETLYNVMMGRASDAGGKADWVSALESGVTRTGVLRGFAASAEFTNICGTYGIVRGDINPNYLEPRDLNPGITKFVARCYTKALGRAYDADGLNYWCGVIISSPTPKATAVYVSTTGFFDSQEFQNRRLDNGAFVDVLYQTFLGRAADAGGRADWVSRLNAGTDRHNVMAGFYNSAEFNAIMAGYGIQ